MATARERDLLLVTGAGGFIGRRVVERALARGAPVRGLERDAGRVEALGRLGVDGAGVTFREYFARLAALAGLPPPRSAPAPLLKALVGAAALVRRALGREPDASPEAVDFLRRPYAVSSRRARAALGFRPAVSLDEGLARTGAWLREAPETAGASPEARG